MSLLDDITPGYVDAPKIVSILSMCLSDNDTIIQSIINQYNKMKNNDNEFKYNLEKTCQEM